MNRATGVSGDQQQATAAYAKALRGEALSERERAALKRFEKQREEQLRWKYYATIPQKHWRQMSGRQTKVLHEQAARYGLPFGGAVVHLPELAKALHDFLATHATKLTADDPLLQGAASPALEQYRQERAALARMERRQRERQLLPREEVRAALGRIATLIRAAGELLERRHGADAGQILLEALREAQLDIDRSFGELIAGDEQVEEEEVDGPTSAEA